MSRFSHKKYPPFQPVQLSDRQWPSNTLTKAPTWCSVDLRDGNQALIEPMDVEKKLKLFKLLVELGFKEIEVGFPAASETELAFMRRLIDEDLIPEDVIVQVLTQAREPIIRKTFESLKGIKQAIVHLYNSTSPAQRKAVFGVDRQGCIDIAVKGAELMCELAAQNPETHWVFEYSPESYSGTESDFAVDICNAVIDVWQPTPDHKAIINLPATVEMSMPNLYADQVEYFCRHVKLRDSVIISTHTHNDRGCGVAAAEMAMLAGAERVEGTLFGNGERTGNVDLITLALNLYTQGIDPELDLSNIDKIVEMVEYCNQIPVHPRHPYAGYLVYTAFSGSHQDAINKGLKAQQENELWDVPYLAIDPKDIGRSYESVIRINSQSGKGGIAYILQQEYGLQMPRSLQVEFSQLVQKQADESGLELISTAIWKLFKDTYLDEDSETGLRYASHKNLGSIEGTEDSNFEFEVDIKGERATLTATGNGPVNGLLNALKGTLSAPVRLMDYSEHAVGEGSEATAYAYVRLESLEQKSADEAPTSFHGVGCSANIVAASMKAVLSAFNAFHKQ